MRRLQHQSLLSIKAHITTTNQFAQSFLTALYDQSKDRDHTWFNGSFSYDECKIYIRNTQRYKSNRQSKQKHSQLLLQNITISRLNPTSLSVRKEYIRSGALHECMMELSDNLLFHYITKYNGSIPGQPPQSLWFKHTNLNSFSQWVVHLFETHLLQAYLRQKSNPLTLLHYVKEHKHLCRHKIPDITTKVTAKEQIDFYIKLSLRKIEENDPDIEEYVCEYPWHERHTQDTLSIIFRKLCAHFDMKHKQATIEEEYKHLIDKEKHTTKKGKNKKKYPKKQTNNGNQENQEKQKKQGKQYENQGKQEKQEKQKKQKNYEKQEKQKKLQKKQEKFIKIQNQKKQEKQENYEQYFQKNIDNKENEEEILKIQKNQQMKQNNSNNSKLKIQQKSQNQFTSRRQDEIQQPKRRPQSLSSTNKRQSSFPPSIELEDEREIQKALDANIELYINQLMYNSSIFQKYRQAAYQIIKSTLSQLAFAQQWHLQMFGSCVSNFSLRQSDIDLVLLIKDNIPDLLLTIYKLLERKKYVSYIKYYNKARVPIITMEIYPLTNSKHTVKLDLSISIHGKNHQGIQNTKFMVELFQKQPNLRGICLVLKQMLRVSKLNKPYKGGIGSFILLMMVYCIIRGHKFKSKYYHQIVHVANYMKDFKPFQTVVSVQNQNHTAPNPYIELNIQDPRNNKMLATSAYRIKNIVNVFQKMKIMLENVEDEFLKTGHTHKKKLRKIFKENIQLFMDDIKDICQEQRQVNDGH